MEWDRDIVAVEYRANSPFIHKHQCYRTGNKKNGRLQYYILVHSSPIKYIDET